jgi:hypothetical protein
MVEMSGGDHFSLAIGHLSLVIDGAIHCAMTNDKWTMTNEKSFLSPILPHSIFLVRADL